MLHSFYHFRRLLATTCLVVFANVLVGQCWCASARPARAAHSGCRRAAAGPAGCCRPAPSGHHTHSGCCRDQKASLLTRLGQPAGPATLLPGPALLPVALALPPQPWADRRNHRRAVRRGPAQQLPPKIPDIRICLRSLTV